ncbi:hypothetical protein M406DRAFT_280553, partial [Cryphonectria parasitica EP155]
MAASEDLINFDVIEAQKENIQALPSGRSAKKLAEVFSPAQQRTAAATTLPAARQPLGSIATPTNDATRAEFEAEVAALAESDDPLDIYDRYVRWILNAYPSAQATSASQLHTVLERATKTFISSSQYKNDPRYLKLWLHYIAFFADAPRETFVFLARHGIGEGLALFYEEYAAWLEGAGRWNQADEVYKLGIEREARPQARLIRKFGEFEARRAAQPEDIGPDSPALPTMRPALAAKIDPFAASEREPRQAGSGLGTQTARSGKPKLQIFSDADSAAEPSALGSRAAGSKGWDTIGSLTDRKKENSMAPKPWAGETLSAGGKKSGGSSKMAVFKDMSKIRSQLSKSHITIAPSQYQVTKNPVNGKKERVFVDLQAVYPSPEEPGTELSFEEIWAANRGWLNRGWEEDAPVADCPENDENSAPARIDAKLVVHHDVVTLDENGRILEQHRDGRGKKKKVMEVNETQIIKANLDSPSRPKMKKKRGSVSEPTMTMHTRAATDDIYDIFNAPLKRPVEEPEESGDDDDYETDSNYTTSNAESTCTTRRISMSEAGDIEEDQIAKDDETSDVRSLSEWSDFSTRRHVPNIDDGDDGEDDEDTRSVVSDLINIRDADPEGDLAGEDLSLPRTRTTFVPIPPEDWVPNPRPYRDPVEVANNRLPFMTPITERTESSLEVDSAETYDRFGAIKTPSKRDDSLPEEVEIIDLEPLSSPLRDVFSEFSPVKKFPLLPKTRTALAPKAVAKPLAPRGPLIKDTQCNPVDDLIRNEILEKMHPPLSSYSGFYDHRHQKYEKGNEIRKFIKATKNTRHSTDRTANLGMTVTISLSDVESEYTLKKELGAGAFAPVYLVENSSPDEEEDEEAPAAMGKRSFAVAHSQRSQRSQLEALKMELPPTPWEFYMMRLSHARLGPQHRATRSLSTALEMHLYQDEGFLLLPFHAHGTLLDVINLFRAESSGVMDETLAMFFAVELLRTVEALHSKQILHGDLKPDNCLLRLDNLPLSSSSSSSSGGYVSSQWRADGAGGWDARGITLIDFGRGIDMRAFVPDVQFVADWKTTAQDCAEIREGRPWTWQIDYHGLAGIIHCLLFGKYIETVRCDAGGLGTQAGRRYRIRESLKRYWQTEIWAECFEVLLNPGSGDLLEQEEGRQMPILKSMRGVREKMEGWLEANCERGVGLRALLGRVEAAARARR